MKKMRLAIKTKGKIFTFIDGKTVRTPRVLYFDKEKLHLVDMLLHSLCISKSDYMIQEVDIDEKVKSTVPKYTKIQNTENQIKLNGKIGGRIA